MTNTYMGQVCLSAAESSMHDYKVLLLGQGSTGNLRQYLTAAGENLSLAKRHGVDITKAYRKLEGLRTTSK